MKRNALLWIFIPVFLLYSLTSGGQTGIQTKSLPDSAAPKETQWLLVIHGGAGGPVKGTMQPQKEQEYLDALERVLQTGADILEKGGTSLDAVESCIRMLEDSPLFNAGKGAVLTEEGKAELDASIMDGATLKAGAVAGVTTIKNPISAARAVMDKTKHVMLIGQGAEKFAHEAGLEMVDPSYFITEERKEQLLKMKREQEKSREDKDGSHGTVGAVALDTHGNLAAGTSTGGMTGKMKGRIGDSPIIGAGTYANNKTCAVSGTGQGEYFIRNVVAYDISALMEYKGMPLEKAANYVIREKIAAQKAVGGLIALDKNGNIAMPFNTNAMFRGFIRSGGIRNVLIY
jgi:L-asparaginase / beta-aspartyl-peptidase